METSKLKTFAQNARRALIELIENKLVFILAHDSLARRENPKAVAELEKQIQALGRESVIEKTGYTWFNRFCALRFMDVNQYNRVRVLSPADGQTQPEILAEAKMGVMDEDVIDSDVRARISGLLGERIPSHDPQNEAYALIVVAVCNYWSRVMPFLFERIAGFTELLMPDDLLSDNSLPALIRGAMSPDLCEDVEVIGWLYQFYVSEKKDEVFAGLKKNKKITPANIPAATQLFTPEWIVKYLVENSLGRLWMINRPGSGLADRMEYYIRPDQEETDFLRVSSPEEIKVCDPACGSGHMLVYAFEILYAIYEEEGYDGPEIPRLILEKNLFGVEIDGRAGGLACFALTMKARGKYRRFFRKGVQPNVCVLEKVCLETGKNTDGELFRTTDEHGLTRIIDALCKTGVKRDALIHDLHLFSEADNFGSLLKPELSADDFEKLIPIAENLEKEYFSDVFLSPVAKKISRALKQGYYLSSKYHVVIANPPYMGGKGMNGRLGAWLKENYPDVKSDLFSAFVVRNTELAIPKGQLGFMTPFVWMFISSYEKLRSFLINQKTITSLIQLEYSGFDGATVPICTFTVENAYHPNFKGGYVRLSDFRGSENQAPKTLEAINNPDCGWFFRASAADFKKIPGSPIAYWVSSKFLDTFTTNPATGEIIDLKAGMSTGDNTIFQRGWHEVSIDNIGFSAITIKETESNNPKWYPCHSGGEYRKWFGNHSIVVNWQNNGHEIRKFGLDSGKLRSAVRNDSFYFKSGITWSKISSGKFAARWRPTGFLFDDTGRCGFSNIQDNIQLALGIFCSILSNEFLQILCPTLSFTSGELAKIPFTKISSYEALQAVKKLIVIGSGDWNSYESSWDFKTLPLLQPKYRQPTLKATYTTLRAHWQEMTLETQRLEQENNRIFIEAYGLQDELTPDVPLSEITLTCNPHYRYGGKKTEEELETLLLADTIKELISYAVGCMFGRYSIDKPGLILANQGETIDDYLAQIPEPAFTPVKDNVIPIMDNDWFTDDITERFKTFIKTSFGEKNYTENLAFIENATGKNIRQYFLKNFYTDHIKTYKKRPIYWMFSSQKDSFKALIYMHRYRPDTASLVLNNYLREYAAKLNANKDNLENTSISATASQKEKTKAIKEIEKIKKIIEELNTYERETLYPLAAKQMEIDLDNGVKANYPKFGKALKKVAGLS